MMTQFPFFGSTNPISYYGNIITVPWYSHIHFVRDEKCIYFIKYQPIHNA